MDILVVFTCVNSFTPLEVLEIDNFLKLRSSLLSFQIKNTAKGHSNSVTYRMEIRMRLSQVKRKSKDKMVEIPYCMLSYFCS